MSKFAVPQPGQTITVTTRSKSHYHLNETGYEDTTYENVPVIPPQSWTPSGSFCIPAENEPFIKFRTISIQKVTDLVVHDGDVGENTEFGTRVVPVQGSGDKIYSVVITDGVAQSCDCLGFMYRKNCRHMRIATGETPINPRRATKKKNVTKGRKAVSNRKGKQTKAARVREIIRANKTNKSQEAIIEMVIGEIGFKRGLAKSYVVNNWEKI